MIDERFADLVARSNRYLIDQNEWCKSEYNIGQHKRFDWNQETEELVWSDDGAPKVIAKIQFVGSISKKSGTWMWSWANPSVLESIKAEILKVKRFGEENGFKKLTEAMWQADETDGWEMTAIAARLLKAKGAYRSPDGDRLGFTFMIITDIGWAKG